MCEENGKARQQDVSHPKRVKALHDIEQKKKNNNNTLPQKKLKNVFMHLLSQQEIRSAKEKKSVKIVEPSTMRFTGQNLKKSKVQYERRNTMKCYFRKSYQTL